MWSKRGLWWSFVAGILIASYGLFTHIWFANRGPVGPQPVAENKFTDYSIDGGDTLKNVEYASEDVQRIREASLRERISEYGISAVYPDRLVVSKTFFQQKDRPWMDERDRTLLYCWQHSLSLPLDAREGESLPVVLQETGEVIGTYNGREGLLLKT
jgi:hypothetical protein